MTTPLQNLLAQFRLQTQTKRDKGTSFENLMVQYFKTEPAYKSIYKDVLSYANWVDQYGDALNITNKKDAGIDLVGVTLDGEYHAIQCKNYNPDETINKSEIDSFFTASGKKYFTHRIIVSTTDKWTKNAEEALENQNPPVSKIDLHYLEQSIIDWSKYQNHAKTILKPQKTLRDHQQTALDAVQHGLKTADRGKLIMACGTGKTFTSLKIAEAMAGKGKMVLFLVPSLSLLSQSLTEWTQESAIEINSFAVCSDRDVGKKHTQEDDSVIVGISDLQFPATTHAKSLKRAITVARQKRPDAMIVVFSTYHSIAVLHEAQTGEHALSAFDLIICDEAHRTTGATYDGEEESAFVRVHDNAFIKGNKRLYMTATPRIYAEDSKKKAKDDNIVMYSMDDVPTYGQELYVITFSQAVARDLLVDYKVIVLAVEESHINRRLQGLLTDNNNSLKVDDAAKIVGCWKALSKQGLFEKDHALSNPMQRAVAFCQVIESTYKGKVHKVSSKLIAEMFGSVVEQYQAYETKELLKENPNAPIDPALTMICEAEHVDGGMNASEKEQKLDWLKAETPENTCRILSNVRCLSEGVDVPALDAVLFLTPRSSQVDVVQSVGRVMRKAPNKELGYVILPVVIPAGIEADKALDNNQTYRVVWQVLNALRSHDDRFDAMINKLEFNGTAPAKMEVIAVADKIAAKKQKQTKTQKMAGQARGGSAIGNAAPPPIQETMSFEVGEIERALYAKIVKKCGNRHHWEDWANDISKIAQTHIDRIKLVLENPENTQAITTFNEFARELRDDLNNSISDAEIVEMLAQHLITKPVFDALFEHYEFTQHNPISKAMQKVLDQFEEQSLGKERNTLNSFYESVQMRANGIHNAEGKQRIIVELYDKFFRNAFPRMTERLGIVYTPIEVVDFIIHSIEHVLKSEFNSSLAEPNVHILDPFTGTGTFITRLLHSGIIPRDKLPHKYTKEIHANEIVLLAYYIAAINIESTYHGMMTQQIDGRNPNETEQEIEKAYIPFAGICLTDTFEMTEDTQKDIEHDVLLRENNTRRSRQQSLDIRVIMGNPPYSAGQESANDNNANVAYPLLDGRIRETYAKYSTATNKNALYDSYIRAIRWASDRIKDCGVIGFVTNASFVDSNTSDGLRKCLTEEFSSLYIFHFKGNARTSGEQRRKEGGNIFDAGSRAPIAISILVKNPEQSQKGQIYFHDIGDYLTRTQKLETIQEFINIESITQQQGWERILPDAFNDWINQRDPNFDLYISMGDKKDKQAITIFENYSRGVATSRDAWVYNASLQQLTDQIQRSINFYNNEVDRYLAQPQSAKITKPENFVIFDSTKFSWDFANKQDLEKGKKYQFIEESLYQALYRPFTKSYCYFNKDLNNRRYQMPRLFPTAQTDNRVISVTGLGVTKDFSCIMTNIVPDVQLQANGQCFPLYLYDTTSTDDLLGNTTPQRRDAITNEALAHFQAAYPNESFTKEDLFYYIYGLLHSEDYRTRYNDNLTKQLPRIPCVKSFADFMDFSKAGRDLAELHIHYETVDCDTSVQIDGLTITPQGIKGGKDDHFYVSAMKFIKKDIKTTVIYNSHYTIKNIPEQAYDYIVNGKPALEWIMERQSVTTDKKTGITNDANDWAIQTMNNPKYPLELFLRIITVSLKTNEIVRTLPKLKL
ncbi:DEAD/DEAH box helicase [Commensalibacter nepenthis]|uniref:DEAD/DEAH box helicase family protein n=1 Tax=Commensalibacter nepenthis TaxID=3043872 RepID=A0ABT6Q5G5_9PROT|nr:type ISP restriction/modification enzyme [Commensalibacter sp. TBRC 10068]MDI2112133.1 DEAD/DEAH box helicase family protein [Commensalibacter sp. TBRC 10068]